MKRKTVFRKHALRTMLAVLLTFVLCVLPLGEAAVHAEDQHGQSGQTEENTNDGEGVETDGSSGSEQEEQEGSNVEEKEPETPSDGSEPEPDMGGVKEKEDSEVQTVTEPETKEPLRKAVTPAPLADPETDPVPDKTPHLVYG